MDRWKKIDDARSDVVLGGRLNPRLIQTISYCERQKEQNHALETNIFFFGIGLGQA